MRKDRRAALSAASESLANVVTCAGLAFSICCLASAAHADDLQMIRNIGDGYKSVKVISRYEIHADSKSFDLFAAVPSTSRASREVERQLAGQTIHQICSGGRMKVGWTVRIFLPDESSPIASCRPGESHGQAQ